MYQNAISGWKSHQPWTRAWHHYLSYQINFRIDRHMTYIYVYILATEKHWIQHNIRQHEHLPTFRKKTLELLSPMPFASKKQFNAPPKTVTWRCLHPYQMANPPVSMVFSVVARSTNASVLDFGNPEGRMKELVIDLVNLEMSFLRIQATIFGYSSC